jgi:hypothetical protein
MGDGDQAANVTDTGFLIQELKDRRNRDEVIRDIGHKTKTLKNLRRPGMFPHDTLSGINDAQLAMEETTLLTLMYTILEKPVENLTTQEKPLILGPVKIGVESATTQETKLKGYRIHDFCHDRNVFRLVTRSSIRLKTASSNCF